MGQVNVNPGGYRDDGAAAAGWSAATMGLVVGLFLLFLVLAYFFLTQTGVVRPITIIQQPGVERQTDRTTVVERERVERDRQPAPQAPPQVPQQPAPQVPGGTTGTGGTGATGGASGTTAGSTSGSSGPGR